MEESTWLQLSEEPGYKAAATLADPCSLLIKATVLKVTCKNAESALLPPFAGDLGEALDRSTGVFAPLWATCPEVGYRTSK